MKRREFVQAAAALGLTAANARWRQLFAAPIASAMVSGHVVCGARPLRDVRVSDGYHVVSTDESGRFELAVGSDSGPFLFVTIPSGYWTNDFYVPTALAVKQSPVFRLDRLSHDSQYTAVYLTDIHLGEGRSEQSYTGLRATIDEINRLEPRPALCWVGGDITLQGGKGAHYVELMSRLKMPIRNAVGNHEMSVREPDPRARFGQLFGPTYYSFDVGQVHYITLDGCHVRPEVEGFRNVEGLLSPRELRWLAADLQRVPPGMVTVASIHIPLVSDYPKRRNTSAAKVPWWVVQNANEVVDLLAQHEVKLVLQGHLHENQRSVQKGIEFVESISVCGRWWKASAGARENGVSGEPRGYRILEIDGSTIRHRYESSAEARVHAIGEVVGRPSKLAANMDTKLSVNIFDPPPDAIVEGTVDSGESERLLPGTTARYHEDLEPAHHWSWTLPKEALTPGRHILRVQVRDSNRQLGNFEHTVMV